MKTEINVTELDRYAYLSAAYVPSFPIDDVNGHVILTGRHGTAGLFIIVRNTGATEKAVTVKAAATHLNAQDAVSVVPAGQFIVIEKLDGQWYASNGSVTLDFEAGFVGEITAFRTWERSR